MKTFEEFDFKRKNPYDETYKYLHVYELEQIH